MTNQQRHDIRYERRKAKRESKKAERAKDVTIERVFDFTDMFRYGRKCCNGVRWKQSTQNFERHLFSKTAKSRRAISNGTWKPDKYCRFTLCERGKERIIDAPKIADRQIHKTLTNKVLLPLYKPYMIYNNGASIKGKGLTFSLSQLKDDLRKHFRRYGREGRVIILDFEKFFPTADHGAVLKRHDKTITDERLRGLLVKAGGLKDGRKGLPLGVELNQAEMTALPSETDNFMRCQLGLKVFGHYMDDYYILAPPNSDHEELLKKIENKAKEYGLILNRAKTKIMPLTKPFRFCKAKVTLTETGKIIMNGARRGMYRLKQKLNKFKQKERKWEFLRTCVQSYIAYYKRYNSHSKVLTIRRTFYSLFGFDAENTSEFRVRDLCNT